MLLLALLALSSPLAAAPALEDAAAEGRSVLNNGGFMWTGFYAGVHIAGGEGNDPLTIGLGGQLCNGQGYCYSAFTFLSQDGTPFCQRTVNLGPPSGAHNILPFNGLWLAGG